MRGNYITGMIIDLCSVDATAAQGCHAVDKAVGEGSVRRDGEQNLICKTSSLVYTSMMSLLVKHNNQPAKEMVDCKSLAGYCSNTYDVIPAFCCYKNSLI